MKFGRIIIEIKSKKQKKKCRISNNPSYMKKQLNFYAEPKMVYIFVEFLLSLENYKTDSLDNINLIGPENAYSFFTKDG